VKTSQEWLVESSYSQNYRLAREKINYTIKCTNNYKKWLG